MKCMLCAQHLMWNQGGGIGSRMKHGLDLCPPRNRIWVIFSLLGALGNEEFEVSVWIFRSNLSSFSERIPSGSEVSDRFCLSYQ